MVQDGGVIGGVVRFNGVVVCRDSKFGRGLLAFEEERFDWYGLE
jgi:hypothetical protein